MSSCYDRIGIEKARTLYAVARALGKEIELKHLDKTCRTLHAVPMDEQVAVVEENGTRTETRTRIFRIPVQDGFEATKKDTEPVVPGDLIKFNQRNYYVLQGGITKLSQDHIYEVQCIQRKRMGSGA